MKMFSMSSFMAGAGIAIGIIVYNKFIASYVTSALPDA